MNGGRTVHNSSLSFDSVILIESLSAGELKTGRDLFDTVMAPANYKDSTFLAELYEVRTAKELIAAFNRVEQLARTHGLRPIIHLEMHGSESGLLLAGGDRLAWSEIAEPLANLNRMTDMNLLVVAALCHGWFMIDILRPTDRAPAYGIVGTANEIASGTLLKRMQRFYEQLLQAPHDLATALAAANTEVHGDDRFRMITAELMLCRIYSHYVQEYATGDKREARVNELVAALAPSHDFDVRTTMALRQQIRSELDDHAKWFGHYRRKFLWLDVLPANFDRFTLTYGDCMRLS
jgi:hypothetical protein